MEAKTNFLLFLDDRRLYGSGINITKILGLNLSNIPQTLKRNWIDPNVRFGGKDRKMCAAV